MTLEFVEALSLHTQTPVLLMCSEIAARVQKPKVSSRIIPRVSQHNRPKATEWV